MKKKCCLQNIIICFFWINFAYAGLFKIPFGIVESYTGTPYLNKKPIKQKQRIYVGDEISTDSNSTIKIKTKKKDILFIGPNTKMIIEDREDINVKQGTIRSIIHKLGPNEAFKVVSGGGVAGVKGTEFIVYANENASALFTKTGNVNLSNFGGEVLTNKGEMSESAYNVAPIEPVNFYKDKKLQDMYILLEKMSGIVVPECMKKFKELPDIIARWNINYTSYLIDKSKFNEALKYLDIAFLFATISDIKAEILMQKFIINTKFLKDYSSALDYLRLIEKEYKNTRFYEDAVFHIGFIGFEIKDYKLSKEYFEKYLDLFPEGKFKNEVNIFLKKIKEEKIID